MYCTCGFWAIFQISGNTTYQESAAPRFSKPARSIPLKILCDPSSVAHVWPFEGRPKVECYNFEMPKKPSASSDSTSKKESTRTVELVHIQIGLFEFRARFEAQNAPQTCALFKTLLPFKKKIIQARWSGDAGWIPLGDFRHRLKPENLTSHPAPGEILLYAFGQSEPEILFPYGGCMFSSKVGQLAGNHFLTIVEGRERLAALGRQILWEGAQDVSIISDGIFKS
jgi:hypothetical protein